MNTIKIKNITNCYYYVSESGEEIRFSNQENVCKILDYLGRLVPSGAETLVNRTIERNVGPG